MKKLYRSETNSMLAGVCGGLGDYFGVDATLIRLGWVLISLMGPGLIAYIIAAIIVPKESEVI
ncbi:MULTISPECIES: PspC domain-containing protein [Anaerotruncus]|uniref:PspC domain-containing protein n=2 Tax=Anaerotruncus TaxID=244127 RepID=A0A498CXF3_9FIRM|nr:MULTISPECIES: PspC domain-containing protein [Anaerotruncus]MBC3939777.1 PspC domain-containing protein [Anaerotruncus massiliensis (ex Togo et al. 2019)]MCQ4895591.1 PspC domain-containing protein [Anaerotruncus sp. DFI.9.16]RLL08104.1 PspC domain-containing protein [Anaerotruncus massiliensis (ex Liu et al. 2021)]GKH48447.1 PspC domain-containing protein [Oscillospiraceae bacterium]